MKGYRTIIVNAAALIASLAAAYGFDIDPGVLSTVALAVVNMGLRGLTTTPIGKFD